MNQRLIYGIGRESFNLISIASKASTKIGDDGSTNSVELESSNIYMLQLTIDNVQLWLKSLQDFLN